MTTVREFFDNGMKCHVVLTKMGHHCGYVAVDPTHPWFGKSYDDIVPVPQAILDRDISGENVGYINLLCVGLQEENISRGEVSISLAIDVHGGLTFSAADREEPLWWFGFDCAHAYDGRGPADPGWRDADYVEAQCRRLSEQLAHIASMMEDDRG